MICGDVSAIYGSFLPFQPLRIVYETMMQHRYSLWDVLLMTISVADLGSNVRISFFLELVNNQ